jgi:DNA (cytosine-5)-methyltransferase 1
MTRTAEQTRHSRQTMKAVTLFAGAGGACSGLRDAGLDVVACYERDNDAVATLCANGLPAIQVDLNDYDWTPISRRRIALVEGGPPCQPFSTAGLGRGKWDKRDCIPAFVDAIAAIRPRIFVMENVRGLTFKRHAAYLAAVIERFEALGYTVEWRVLNAADFGVPQTRQRLFVVGRRDGVPIEWPRPTHDKSSPDRLPWVTMASALGWNDIVNTRGNRKTPGGNVFDPARRPSWTITGTTRSWKRQRHEWPVIPNTISLQRRQNNAPPINACTQPAPTVTAGAVASGQWEVTDQAGNRTKLTPEEAALLQDFKPGWKFVGSRSSVFRQIGNACPRRLTQAVAGAQIGTWPIETPTEARMNLATPKARTFVL